jgi:hypothetical protein
MSLTPTAGVPSSNYTRSTTARGTRGPWQAITHPSHIRRHSKRSGAVREFEEGQVSRPFRSDPVPTYQPESASQAENASSILVTRSTTKAQVSRHFRPLGLRRVRDQNGRRDPSVTLRIRPCVLGGSAKRAKSAERSCSRHSSNLRRRSRRRPEWSGIAFRQSEAGQQPTQRRESRSHRGAQTSDSGPPRSLLRPPTRSPCRLGQ